MGTVIGILHVATTLAQSGQQPDVPGVTLTIAAVLTIGVLIASLMSSKRGHRD